MVPPPWRAGRWCCPRCPVQQTAQHTTQRDAIAIVLNSQHAKYSSFRATIPKNPNPNTSHTSPTSFLQPCRYSHINTSYASHTHPANQDNGIGVSLQNDMLQHLITTQHARTQVSSNYCQFKKYNAIQSRTVLIVESKRMEGGLTVAYSLPGMVPSGNLGSSRDRPAPCVQSVGRTHFPLQVPASAGS